MRITDKRKATSLAAALGLVAAGLVAAAAPATAVAAPNGISYKILVLTGPDSAVSGPGADAIRALGNDGRFTVEVTGDVRKFDVPHLKQFRVVVFLDSAGRQFTADQRTAFEDYFHDG